MYTIETLDLNDNEVRIKCTNLVNQVFNLNLNEDKLLLNTNTRNNQSLYLGAFKDNELAAINFFIGHEFLIKENTFYGHQSCWSATSPKHRKKGLFTKLINEAKVILKINDSSFIFGFPNQNSEQIFIKKLGFRKIPLKKVNIPVKFFSSIFLKKFINQNFEWNHRGCLKTIESELIDLKTNEYGDSIKVIEGYNNLIWGKVTQKKTKFGDLSVFNIGGVQLNKPKLISNLFTQLINSEKIDLIQIVAVESNQIWNLINFSKIACNTEPLIVFDLNLNTNQLDLNISIGIKDVF